MFFPQNFAAAKLYLRGLFFLMACVLFNHLSAQNNAGTGSLTVDKIMQDPRWIGTSPSDLNWSADSKTVFFRWNPNKKTSDSLYAFALNATATQPANEMDLQKSQALNAASYNSTRTQMVYVYRGDIYWAEVKTGKTLRLTQTEEFESAPYFIQKDQWVVFTRNQNLYAWQLGTGMVQQLTNITRGAETQAAPAFAGRGGFGGGQGGGFQGQGGGFQGQGGGQQGGGQRASGGAANALAPPTQDGWLGSQQLDLFQVLRERKAKREERDANLKKNKYTGADTLKAIGIGDKFLQGLQVNADGRFVTYRLGQAATGGKSTIVPSYVTETGYTTDLPARTKVGNPLGTSELYVYDKIKDTVYKVSTDSVPGIRDLPDYAKDYPARYANRRPTVRATNWTGAYWNEAGDKLVVDLRSQDNKDRWILQLDPLSGKLSLVQRQRDEAWIGGPGVGFGARMGWIDNNRFYFQGENSGYSHVYVHYFATGQQKDLTPGNFEVQQLILSRDKKTFYLLTNETHPGKTHFYRMKTDGTAKEQITVMEGGHEVELSPDEKWIAYRYSFTTKPWELYVQENAPGKKPQQVTNLAQSDAFKAYAWRETPVEVVKARDGGAIYTRVFEPAPGTKNGAAVFFVHGAGYLQNVHYWWSSYFRETMFNNLLADLGYTVVDIDYRASSGYGRDWRTGIYRHMGGKDLSDHVDVADWLVKTKGIDPARIGIYGGSYGGFMTLMALFTTPDVFKAGAALRPVTDWAHYNHGYTANILNEPVQDSIAYARSSPINFASGLKNHLLICHGMVDVNVHFQDAVRLQQKLIELGKENWELAAYPVEDHGFVEPSSWADEYKRILKLFQERLKK